MNMLYPRFHSGSLYNITKLERSFNYFLFNVCISVEYLSVELYERKLFSYARWHLCPTM
jgi:hypothetical protein